MIKPVEWTRRGFDFTMPVTLFPAIIERLRGTPLRLDSLMSGLNDKSLSHRVAKWSIKEQIGHLIEVEVLWDTRLDDFDAGLDTLRPADMSNQSTDEANYNDQDIESILRRFHEGRSALIARLEPMDEAMVSRSAYHARLDTQMRVLDLAMFAAEHDDHHLAMISYHKRTFR